MNETTNSHWRENMMVITVLAASFLFLFNQFLLITAFPTIMDEFSINATQVQWLTTSFLLMATMLIPTMGYLMSRFSARALTMTALACFVIGTVLSAIAPSFVLLVSARVVQAIGAGMMLPLVQTILLHVYPAEKRGYAMGLMALVINVAPAIGPPISGYIVDWLGWRSLFWLVLPLAVAIFVLAAVFMENVTEQKSVKFDLLSLFLTVVGFSGVIFGLSNISIAGFSSAIVLVPLSAGFFAIAMFIWRQLCLDSPMLELRLFKHSWFVHGVILSFVISILLLSTETLLPLFIQDVQGRSAFSSGMILLPGTVLLALTSFASGKLFDSFGGRALGLSGYGILVLVFTIFMFMGDQTGIPLLVVCFCAFMVGIGFTMTPATAIAMNALKQAELAHGTAIANTIRQFGAALGLTVLTTLVSVNANRNDIDYVEGTLAGLKLAFGVMAILALVAWVLVYTAKEKNTQQREELGDKQ
ncbi:DHA2 family efflux MFS transporter permease subunit [Shouchella clausii]|uniref:DHA2 family efflux MFS transporter permease subunit n=1 Tax=Shouchella clausii TaxID=79880 RepID=UPI00398367C8